MRNPELRVFVSIFGLFGIPALTAMPVCAQNATPVAQTADTIPNNSEIIVTAQRRSERQVDVPIAITTLSGQQLGTANVQNLADIQKLTPSLRFDSQAAFVQPSIRGIGTGITTSGGGSNVGIYIDGFYSPNPTAADFQLTKVESIQVLKGPQGTLFGHNTTGGAILVTTSDPSEELAADFKASYGRFNAQHYQGYTTFGLAKGLAMDVEGVFAKGNGFVTNIVDNDNHVGAYQNWTIRTGLKAQLGDAVSVLARYEHADMNDPTGQMLNSNTDTSIDPTTGKPWGIQTETFGGPGTYTTNPDQIAANQKRITHTKSDIGQLTIKADLGFANLTSYTQYRKENTAQSEDLDQTALPIFQLGLPIADSTWSQELLLTSKSGPKLQWTAGFFFFNNKDTWTTFIDPGSFFGAVPPGRLGGSGTTTRSYAGFADATYQVLDKLYLTAGLRYSHDQVVDAFYCVPGTACKTRQSVADIGSNHATPRVVLRFKPDDHSSIYASYTKGYKAAILDVGGSCQDGPAFLCNPIKPEDINSYEIGYKYADRRLSFETSAFFYDYKNLQVSEFLGNALAYILNAAKSQIYGVDAEAHYKFGDHFQLNAGGAWTHGRYKTFGGQSVILPDGTTTISGAPIYATCPGGFLVSSCYASVTSNTSTILHNVHMQHVPDFTATIGPRLTTGRTDRGELALSGNLYYSSYFFFSPSGTQFRQPGYAALDLRLQWDDPTRRYMVAAYGTNVTNERYRTQVQYNGFGIGAEWSQPASWGLEMGAKF
jgi:iron complex outermembrane receptor protein